MLITSSLHTEIFLACEFYVLTNPHCSLNQTLFSRPTQNKNGLGSETNH